MALQMSGSAELLLEASYTICKQNSKDSFLASLLLKRGTVNAWTCSAAGGTCSSTGVEVVAAPVAAWKWTC